GGGGSVEAAGAVSGDQRVAERDQRDFALPGADGDPAEHGADARHVDDRGGGVVGGVPGVLSDVSLFAVSDGGGGGPVSREPVEAAVPDDPALAHGPGGGHPPDDLRDAHAGGAAAVGRAPADRRADVLAVALRVGDGGGRLLDALPLCP